MKILIINADGYGLTYGVTQAIEECVAHGSVRSVSVNVNFSHARRLQALAHDYPDLSIGCHLNPIVGKPTLAADAVRSLLNAVGEFLGTSFTGKFLSGAIKRDELRAELWNQIRYTRELIGERLTHIDFHKGLHRLPGLYSMFLDLVEQSRVGRMRTHKYISRLDDNRPRIAHCVSVLSNPFRAAKYLYNLRLRSVALGRRLSMPDAWVEITGIGSAPLEDSLARFDRLLKHLPDGVFELVAHPGYVDNDLPRLSSYVVQRERERQFLLSSELMAALSKHSVTLGGYRDLARLSQ